MELGLSGWLSSDAISNDQVSLWCPKKISESTTLVQKEVNYFNSMNENN